MTDQRSGRLFSSPVQIVPGERVAHATFMIPLTDPENNTLSYHAIHQIARELYLQTVWFTANATQSTSLGNFGLITRVRRRTMPDRSVQITCDIDLGPPYLPLWDMYNFRRAQMIESVARGRQVALAIQCDNYSMRLFERTREPLMFTVCSRRPIRSMPRTIHPASSPAFWLPAKHGDAPVPEEEHPYEKVRAYRERRTPATEAIIVYCSVQRIYLSYCPPISVTFLEPPPNLIGMASTILREAREKRRWSHADVAHLLRRRRIFYAHEDLVSLLEDDATIVLQGWTDSASDLMIELTALYNLPCAQIHDLIKREWVEARICRQMQ